MRLPHGWRRPFETSWTRTQAEEPFPSTGPSHEEAQRQRGAGALEVLEAEGVGPRAERHLAGAGAGRVQTVVGNDEPAVEQ